MIRSAKKIYEVVDSLSEEKQREILDFAEYLHFREIERGDLTAQIVESIKQVKNKKVRSARDLVNDLWVHPETPSLSLRGAQRRGNLVITI